MTRQTIEQTPAGRKAKPAKSVKRTGGRKNAVNGKASLSENRGQASGTRKAQLIALLSRKGGVRISAISERLGWQPHTVRAAISGLRKQGFDIATSKTSATKGSKTSPSGARETVYAIVASSGTTDAASDGTSR